ncbi:MAG: preprotein translocase subunit SecG [Candidatus Pacebacteria bacterium]|nr:preprotein translocase subunit SecG [Candidatus Paceibacterota bacterium]
MNKVLLIAQIIVSLVLIGSILLQSQGTGMSPIWGGGGEHYHTRRGIEKILFGITIIGIVFFIVLSILNVVVSQ